MLATAPLTITLFFTTFSPLALSAPLSPLDESLPTHLTPPATPFARQSFCASVSRFLESASCGDQHTPCLSLALQAEINAKCLHWRGSRKDSLAWDVTADDNVSPTSDENLNDPPANEPPSTENIPLSPGSEYELLNESNEGQVGGGEGWWSEQIRMVVLMAGAIGVGLIAGMALASGRQSGGWRGRGSSSGGRSPMRSPARSPRWQKQHEQGLPVVEEKVGVGIDGGIRRTLW